MTTSEKSPFLPCEVPDCAGAIVAHGLCEKHYRRVRRHGDVNHGRPKGYGAKASHPFYGRWKSMTRNSGGGVDSRWSDFWLFVQDVGQCPSDQHRLYRIENSKRWSKDNYQWRKNISDERDAADRLSHAEYQRAYIMKRPDVLKRAHLKKHYGLMLERFNEMRAAQGDVCAICCKGEFAKHAVTGEPRALAVDHDHSSGQIRGLLCTNCNKGVGCFRDDPALLRAAIAYLESHAQAPKEEAA
jgi:hypothetical protein